MTGEQEIITGLHPHEVYSRVVHRCLKCEEHCEREKGEGSECIRSNFVGEIIVKLGEEHK